MLSTTAQTRRHSTFGRGLVLPPPPPFDARSVPTDVPEDIPEDPEDPDVPEDVPEDASGDEDLGHDGGGVHRHEAPDRQHQNRSGNASGRGPQPHVVTSAAPLTPPPTAKLTTPPGPAASPAPAAVPAPRTSPSLQATYAQLTSASRHSPAPSPAPSPIPSPQRTLPCLPGSVSSRSSSGDVPSSGSSNSPSSSSSASSANAPSLTKPSSNTSQASYFPYISGPLSDATLNSGTVPPSLPPLPSMPSLPSPPYPLSALSPASESLPSPPAEPFTTKLAFAPATNNLYSSSRSPTPAPRQPTPLAYHPSPAQSLPLPQLAAPAQSQPSPLLLPAHPSPLLPAHPYALHTAQQYTPPQLYTPPPTAYAPLSTHPYTPLPAHPAQPYTPPPSSPAYDTVNVTQVTPHRPEDLAALRAALAQLQHTWSLYRELGRPANLAEALERQVAVLGASVERLAELPPLNVAVPSSRQ